MEEKIEIKRYSPDFKIEWDTFVESSKNGTFLFKRDYMDYHSDRFHDYSLLFYRKGKLYCLLPANKKDDVVYSHQGLTYGGLIMNDECTAEGILKIFSLIIENFRKEGISKFIYSPVPQIYHSIPSEEDLYALFRNDAVICKRNISSVIYLSERLGFSKLRKRMVAKSRKNGIEVKESKDFARFWEILSENLKEKYAAVPVHSLSEIEKLSELFPEIKLIAAFSGSVMIGGVVCYYTKRVIKVQYISADVKGKELGAIDAIFNHLLNMPTSSLYFDFGTSNEDGGRYLNETLIHQKEGFGGRAVCYDTWQIRI